MLDVFARIFCMRNSLMDPKERAARSNSPTRKKSGRLLEPSGAAAGNNVPPGYTNTSFNNKNPPNSKDKRHVDFKYDRVGVYELQTDENWRPTSNGLERGGDTDDVTSSDRHVILPTNYNQLEGEVREIRRHLRIMVDKSSERASREYVAREWKLCALVLDRLFFCLYLIMLIASVFGLFDFSVFDSYTDQV